MKRSSPGWIAGTLGDFAEPERVGIDPASVPGLPYLGLEHVQAHTTNILGTSSAASVRSTSYGFDAGATLFARLRPYLNKVCTPSFRGIGSSEFIIFPPCTHLAPGFLKYLLNQPAFVEFTATLDTGDRPRVNWSGIRNFPCALPPFAEQQRIVAIIEEQFSRLDGGVVVLERVRQNLRRMTASVLEAAVSGRLTDAFPGSPLDDPSEWDVVTVGEVTEVSGGITKNPKRQPRANPIPFLRVANVQRDALDLKDVHEIEVFEGELDKLRLRRGDLLVVEGNGSPDQIGRSAIWDGSIDPCVHQNHLIRVRAGVRVLPAYLNLFWNAPSSIAKIRAVASSTSGLYTLSTGKVRSIPVALPPIETQERIVVEVERQLSFVESLDRELVKACTLGRSLRSSVLSDAFSGKLATQDPNDENASILLERIALQLATSNGHQSSQARDRRRRKIIA